MLQMKAILTFDWLMKLVMIKKIGEIEIPKNYKKIFLQIIMGFFLKWIEQASLESHG